MLGLKMAIDVRRRRPINKQSRLRDKKSPYVAVLLLIIFYGIVTLGLGIVHLAFY
jgi:hypothetical protein